MRVAAIVLDLVIYQRETKPLVTVHVLTCYKYLSKYKSLKMIRKERERSMHNVDINEENVVTWILCQ